MLSILTDLIKFLALPAMLCGFMLQLNAQSGCTSTFAKTLGSALSNESGYSLAVDDIRKVLYVGASMNDSTMIVKVNANGDILWSRTFDVLAGQLERTIAILLDSDGMLCLAGMTDNSAGGSSFLVRYDPVQDLILWAKVYDHPSETYAFGLIEKEAGGNYLLSINPLGVNDAELLEINRNTGLINVNFSTHYDLGSAETIWGMMMYEDDLYVTGRYTDGVGSDKMRTVLSRMDADNGLPSWTKLGHLPSNANARLYGTDLVIDNDEIYVISTGNPNGTDLSMSQMYIHKATLDGQVLWTKHYAIPAMDDVAEEIIATGDGFIIMGRNAGPTDLFLFKINHEGEVQWARTYDFSGNETTFPTGGTFTQLVSMDGALYFTAWLSQSGRRDMILVKTDSEGRLDDDCTVAKSFVLNVSNESNATFYTVVPNAFTYVPTVKNLTPTIANTSLPTENTCLKPGNTEITIQASICEGDSFEGYAQAGTYADTFSLQSGCDSIRILHLDLIQPIVLEMDTILCGEMSFAFNDSTINASGDYVFHQSICDSTFIFHVFFFQPDTTTQSISLCAGDSILFNTMWVKNPGTYMAQLTNQYGCDSISILHLDLIQPVVLEKDTILCGGMSFEFNDSTINVSGDYIFQQANCDSIFIFHVFAFQSDTTIQSISRCTGDSLFFNTMWIKDSGTYMAQLTNQYGCDSLSILHLTVDDNIAKTQALYLCAGDSLWIVHRWIYGAGQYADTVPGIKCDTILETTIIPAPVYLEETEIELCPGDSVWLDNRWIRTTETTIAILTSIQGCDSTVITHVTALPKPSPPALNVDCDEGLILVSGNADPPWTYEWNNGSTESTTTYETAGPAYVILYYPPACELRFDFEIPAIPTPMVLLTLHDTILLEKHPLKITLGLDPDEWTIHWLPEDIFSCPNCMTTIVSPTTNTTVQVQLIHTSGCVYAATFDITIEAIAELYIPNVFSPNADQVNDEWLINTPGEKLEIHKVTIFDRWGNLIKEWNNTNEIAWDGMFRNKPMNPGVFTYLVEYIDQEMTKKVETGNITLLR